MPKVRLQRREPPRPTVISARRVFPLREALAIPVLVACAILIPHPYLRIGGAVASLLIFAIIFGEGFRITIAEDRVTLEQLLFGMPWRTIRFPIDVELRPAKFLRDRHGKTDETRFACVAFHAPGRNRSREGELVGHEHAPGLLALLEEEIERYRDGKPGEATARSLPG
jgi:hypothetical protein